MKRLILLLIVISLLPLAGCRSAAKREARAEIRAKEKIIMGSNLQLGMTKDEVIKLYGQPTQMGAIKSKSGKALESFIYIKSKTNAWTGVTRARDYYIYFEDGKVVSYGGIPIMPNDYL